MKYSILLIILTFSRFGFSGGGGQSGGIAGAISNQEIALGSLKYEHGSSGGGVVGYSKTNIFTPSELAQYSPTASISFKKLNLDPASWNSATNDNQVGTEKAGQVSYFGFGSAATLKDYGNVYRTSKLSDAMNKAARYTLENHGFGQVQSSTDMEELSYGMKAIGLSRVKELGHGFDKVILKKGTRIEAEGSSVIVEEEDAPSEILFDFSEAVMDLNSNPYLKSED